MLKQQLPSVTNRMVQPPDIRAGRAPRGFDVPGGRGRGRGAGAASDRPEYAAPPPAVPFVEMDSATSGWWWTAMAFLMEGFALYGASLHPSATFSIDEASARADAHRAHVAASRQPAMIYERRASQALSDSNVIVPGLAAWAEQPPRRNADWIAGLGETVVAFWTRWRNEREVRRAVKALAEYDDRTLLDIGIRGRADIERMVRYCRDC
ncbi:Protein of unknown function (DUF1127) [Bradyrhizobium sp. YR681]|uniref:DUF1127 domain-containing protein n=1 Tax=Bradyrhizobium sp. YR681 TaxID=1144344 RepID=UPI00026F97A4|nr:DUF1127 domain-containing protein [Bradyrhizobium sp. YR681]EJN10590.1 Protein of unknown function (DUF1127) [Bradyrhizobium sp. YR681]